MTACGGLSMRHRSFILSSGGKRCAAAAVTVLLVACALALLATPVIAKNVHVTVQASWSETPLLAEGCEAVSGAAGQQGFFGCLEAVEARLSERSPQERQQVMLSQQLQHRMMEDIFRATWSSRSRVALAEMQLAARVFSPAVEAQRQVARRHVSQCENGAAAFAVLPAAEDQVHCSVGDLASAMAKYIDGCGRNESSNSDSDVELVGHLHPQSATKSCQTLVLYGIIGEATTGMMYTAAAAHFPRIRLIFRHAPYPHQHQHSSRFGTAEQLVPWASPLRVAGYGVALDLKNMEYKVIDEKGTANQEASVPGAGAGSERRHEAPVAGLNISRLIERYPAHSVALEGYADELEEEAIGAADVKMNLEVWELQSMGLFVASAVMETEKPLEKLRDILHNFPLHASRLSTTPRTASMNSLQEALNRVLQPLMSRFGAEVSTMFINGRHVLEENADLFFLLEQLDKDEAMKDSLARILAYRPTAVEALELSSTVADVLQCAQPRVSESKRSLRYLVPEQSLYWLNDITTDPQFAPLKPNVQLLLKNSMYGGPIHPRQNLFHFVLVIDPTDRAHWALVIEALESTYRGDTIRVGIALQDREWTDGSVAYEATLGNSGKSAEPLVSVACVLSAAAFELTKISREAMRDVWEAAAMASAEEPRLAPELARTIAEETLRRNGISRPLADILSDPDFAHKYFDAQRGLREMKLSSLPASYINGVPTESAKLREAMRRELYPELLQLRSLVASRVLNDVNVQNSYQVILRHHKAVVRVHPAILAEKYIPMSSNGILRVLAQQPYLYHANYAMEAPLISHVVVVPGLTTVATLRTLHRLLQAIATTCSVGSEECRRSRLTFVSCSNANRASGAGDDLLQDSSARFWRDLELLLLAAGEMGEQARAKLLLSYSSAVLQVLDKADARTPDGPNLTDAELYTTVMAEARLKLDSKVLRALKEERSLDHSSLQGFCAAIHDADRDLRRLGPGAAVMYTNGRRVEVDEHFTEVELVQLAEPQLGNAKVLWDCIASIDFQELSSEFSAEDLTNDFFGSKLSAISSIVLADCESRGYPTERHLLPIGIDEKTSFTVQPVEGGRPATHKLTFVINPVSRVSQHLVSLCEYALHSPLGVQCTFVLNPARVPGKLPITNFYQYVAPLGIQFDAQGYVVPPSALFRRMPAPSLLTLGIDEPESWLVFPHIATQDLDNIVLANLPRHVQTLSAAYRIRSILVTGSAVDESAGLPPRGLPLVLRNHPDPSKATESRDTLIMYTKGYFQLKSDPGVWYLGVVPGAASSLYYVSGVDDGRGIQRVSQQHAVEKGNQEPNAFHEAATVSVDSFRGKFVALHARKRRGKEHVEWEQVLQEQVRERELQRARAKPRRWSLSRRDPVKPTKPTVNIFSVASGHLYERFLRLMMYTVMQSSSKVRGGEDKLIKFWLIENFLSPQFKDFVPRMAKHYGFEVGFVTYRWPNWLRRQSEKQRTIWAYKILFLDVLFPLEVDRVIFVDADQIVRADIHKLYDMNIEGAPVAYTPFCRKNMNQETKGFRFWDTGSWQRHLKGKPYHISAIYLVDLLRLRAIAGGERYRIAYQQLSGDPNSLANLDQDLPNYIQDQVRIYSLPEEWLWCETWCNNASKPAAKTIDLCNNPLTKTPKLENAKRIIPNWSAMDDMLEALAKELMEQPWP